MLPYWPQHTKTRPGTEESRPLNTESEQPAVAAETDAPSPRFHELDALRAFAMLLGVVLHTALFFMPDAWSKAYSAEGYPAEVSGFYTLLFYAIHGFRMPVFFLLSGFFTALLWQRRGLRPLAVQRLKRIGLPLAAGAFTVIPVTTIAFLWAFDVFQEVEFSIFWWPFIWLSTLNHLWFLWFLLWLCGGFIVAAKLGVRFDHPIVWWLAIPLTLLPQLLMTEPVFGPDTSEGLAFDPVVLAYYALFFLFGAHLYRRGIQASRWWTLALAPALTLVFWAGLTLLYDVKEDWAKPLAAVAQVAFAWLMCFGLMGLFRLIAHRGAVLGTLPVRRFLLDLPVAPAPGGGGVRADRRLAHRLPREVRPDKPGRHRLAARRLPARRALHAGGNDAERQTHPPPKSPLP